MKVTLNEKVSEPDFLNFGHIWEKWGQFRLNRFFFNITSRVSLEKCLRHMAFDLLRTRTPTPSLPPTPGLLSHPPPTHLPDPCCTLPSLPLTRLMGSPFMFYFFREFLLLAKLKRHALEFSSYSCDHVTQPNNMHT